MRRSTNLVIISGPSGAGKDAVIAGLIERGLPIERIVTTITRAKRQGEVEGKSHYFISAEEMQNKIKNDELAEWAEVYGNIYGVTKTELERVKALKNKIGIWRIEEQGARTARKLYPDILTMAITAPAEELIKRAVGRGDKKKEISFRISSEKEWTGQAELYDYEIENKTGQLQKTIDQVIAILKKEEYLS